MMTDTAANYSRWCRWWLQSNRLKVKQYSCALSSLIFYSVTSATSAVTYQIIFRYILLIQFRRSTSTF